MGHLQMGSILVDCCGCVGRVARSTLPAHQGVPAVRSLPEACLSVCLSVTRRGIPMPCDHGTRIVPAYSRYIAYKEVDCTDHMCANTRMKIVSRKYWHAMENHGRKMVAAVAYQIAMDLVSGLNPDWFHPEKKRISFGVFRHRLGRGLMAYDPRRNKFPGDKHTRAFTQLNQYERIRLNSSDYSPPRRKRTVKSNGDVTRADISDAMDTERFCNDFAELRTHLVDHYSASGKGNCHACGGYTKQRCGICNVPLHFVPQSGRSNGDLGCAIDYHDINFFGLAYCDHSIRGIPANDWKRPSDEEREKNAKHIAALRRNLSEQN